MKIKIILFTFLFGLSALFFSHAVFAEPSDTPTPTQDPNASVTPTPSGPSDSQLQDLENQISDYEDKISTLQGQEKTLSSSIDLLNSKINLTQLRINAAKEQIADLGTDIDVTKKRIGSLETNIDESTKAMLGRISGVYEVGNIQPWEIFLSSNNIQNFFTRLKYLRMVQIFDKKTIYAAQQSKVDYADEKTTLESKQKEQQSLQTELVGYTAQYKSDEDSKKTLLSQTQGNEANYQHLLDQARAELNGFSKFVQNSGGAGLLSGQTSCDSWGCYYNQRDSQWGGILINGQSGYDIAGYGCLITSLSMVASHMGHHVLPSDIATSGDNNFSVGTAMLKYSINVDGLTISRNSMSRSSMDSALQSGPVVVGIYAYGGTHFVVLKSGSGGNYVMDDPYISGGHDINFTDHYSLGSIFEIDRVSM